MSDANLSTPAEALALLPIQTNGEIGAQDIRDIANSVPYVGSGMWNDVQGTIEQGTGPTALAYEAYRDTPWKCYHWQHNQADELHYTYQMTHSWNRGSVKPHLHVIPLASGSGVFAISGTMAWVGVSGTLGAAASWTSFHVTRSFTPADQYQHLIVSLGTVAPRSGAHSSDVLCVYMKRNSGVTDTYTTNKTGGGTAQANVALLSSDVHYQATTLGSVAEIGD